MGQGALAENPAPRWKVFSWGLWDWGTQPFATVITTFVFSVYITSSAFGPENYTSVALSIATGTAGVLIALLAPVLGQGTDRSGKRMFHLRWQTWLLAAISAALWFVAPEANYLVLGLTLLAAGNLVSEIANVNYYAALDQVSTPRTVGRISGLGWGLGYLGGISILLLIVGLRGAEFTADDVRFSMLVCGAWTLLFTIPIFVALKDKPVAQPPPPRSVQESYADLFRSLKRVYRASPHTVYFLLASALFRDGLSGVFTFGAVLAAGTFGFEFSEVIIFGIVANVTAGISTMLFGLLDDRIGPKKVIMISLVALVALGLAVFFLHDGGTPVFWVLGLAMTLFVGPAQSASRSFLARSIPEGKSGEIFGLYATTGRAVSFFSSVGFGGAIVLGTLITGSEETQYFGILGIVLVLLAGLLVMIPVKEIGPSFADTPARG
ncbi:MFS transporter [Tessaracoccus sp. OS52]|nr:MFS transporter [Tessaracoccus sp. OS52]MCC2593891.1 MFS transporter [Tessaracoccus sp. OS52]